MDRVSVVKLVGSCGDVEDLADRSIKSINDHIFSLKKNDLTLTLLEAQLCKLKVALQQIEQWIQYDLATERHHQSFTVKLESTLSACKLLLSVINQHFGSRGHRCITADESQSRIRSVWEGKIAKDCLAHLTWQVSAANVLISAFQCHTRSEQKQLLESKWSRRVFDQVRDDSSSLILQYDCSSFLSQSSTKSSKVSLYFGIEDDVFETQVYQGAVRSLLLKSVKEEQERSHMKAIDFSDLKDGTLTPLPDHERIKIHRIVHPATSSDPAFMESCLRHYSRLHGDEKDSWFKKRNDCYLTVHQKSASRSTPIRTTFTDIWITKRLYTLVETPENPWTPELLPAVFNDVRLVVFEVDLACFSSAVLDEDRALIGDLDAAVDRFDTICNSYYSGMENAPVGIVLSFTNVLLLQKNLGMYSLGFLAKSFRGVNRSGIPLYITWTGYSLGGDMEDALADALRVRELKQQGHKEAHTGWTHLPAWTIKPDCQEGVAVVLTD